MIRTCRLSWLVLVVSVSVVTPAVADSFLVYTEGGIPAGSAADRPTHLWTWCDQGQPCVTELEVCGAPEGARSMRVDGNAWSGMGVFFNVDESTNPATPGSPPVDMSAFANGDMRFWVKTPDAGIGAFNVKVEFQCRPNVSVETYTTSISNHGWDGTSAWQEIVIPIASFFAPQPVNTSCLETVVSPFMSTIENLPFFNSFVVDYVRWHLPNPHPGPSSVEVQGRQLYVDGEPFVVNGAAYAPISICEDYHGGFRDRPDRYLVDFPLMAASGINTVRIYSSFLTTAMLDAAWAQGLYVIPTFQIDLVQNQCAAGQDFMQDRLREMVTEWKDHPAILFWMVGSEVNSSLTSVELCQDWYPQLDALAQTAHEAEGESFHPVGTANAELGDICVTACSDDTTLPNLDLWATHLYRGCTFGTAFLEYQQPDCARPLIVGEFGVDAWDSLLGAENETMQANCLEDLLDEADQGLAVRNPGGVSSGQIIFEWADEWWKAAPVAGGDCDETTDWCQHDTCANWTNLAYPDPAINEEWWGINSLDSVDPDFRGPRAARGRVSAAWNLGAVCNLEVVDHDTGTGNTTMTFDPGAGSTDTTVYYGPLGAVSTYGYSGAATGLGATGSGSVTLPAGSLFWVAVARDNGAEGCFGNDSGCGERPQSPGSVLPQSPNRTCQCSGCP